MICVTRLNGDEFALNPDVIQRVEGHPDTVITLLDDTKYVIRETVSEVIRAIRDFRAGVLHTAHMMDAGSYFMPLHGDERTGPGAAVFALPNREER